jgi:hypothetical protein
VKAWRVTHGDETLTLFAPTEQDARERMAENILCRPNILDRNGRLMRDAGYFHMNWWPAGHIYQAFVGEELSPKSQKLLDERKRLIPTFDVVQDFDPWGEK